MRRLREVDRPAELVAFKKWATRSTDYIAGAPDHLRQLKDENFSDVEGDDRGVLTI